MEWWENVQKTPTQPPTGGAENKVWEPTYNKWLQDTKVILEADRELARGLRDGYNTFDFIPVVTGGASSFFGRQVERLDNELDAINANMSLEFKDFQEDGLRGPQ